MVLQQLAKLLIDRFGCDAEDVEMAASFDDLNITEDERYELFAVLWELYGTETLPEELPPFATVEDLVGYIEDRMG